MMKILVTGGTGSLGKVLVPALLQAYPESRIRILSRNEHTQIKLEETGSYGDRVDWFIGDIRDRDRVMRASRDCDAIFHLAAMKSVDKAEYNPNEAVSINILGTQNVIHSALENGVRLNLFTSTDKAVEPLNIYGATKLAAEKLWIQSNCYAGNANVHFSAVRYGNVLNSAGSVLEKWIYCVDRGIEPYITSGEMTRFFILQEQAVFFIMQALKSMEGGEVYIPSMRSTTIEDLWNAFCEVKNINPAKCKKSEIRPGEKIHETLISENEISMTTRNIIMDGFIRWPNKKLFPCQIKGEPLNVKYHEGYRSDRAERFDQEQLKQIIREAIKS